MIKIKIKKTSTIIEQILIHGHALYDDYGKDIVCAGVSAILTTTVNGIIAIDSSSIKYQKDQNKFSIDVLNSFDVTQKLLQNMIDLFIELQTKYPQNIKVEEEQESCKN